MAQTKRDHKLFHYDEDALTRLLDGVEEIYKSVSVTYGPKGRNFLIEKPYGKFVLTRDGATVAKESYDKARAKNMGMQGVNEASQTTNRVAGDGTTATVVLTRNLIREGAKLIRAGKDPMEVREQINNDAKALLSALEGYVAPIKKGQLEQVATVSSGDPLLGKMVAEAVEKVGENGGIIAEKAHVSGVEREYVDGYYMQSGFTAITEGRKELENCLVVVTSKRLASHVDALEVLNKLAKAHEGQRLRVAFVGEIEGDAYKTIVGNVMQGNLDAIIVATPSTGEMGIQYLEDIAIYTGAKLLSEGDNIQSFDGSYAGKANRVVCTQSTTSIFSDAGIKEDIAGRLDQLKNRLENEESEFLSEKIRDRMAKLEGKIALFRIGGATETEKEEKEFRIEDAIQATRAAYSRGVVPGGGTTLLRLVTASPYATEVSDLTKSAVEATFRKLLDNARLPSEVKLHEILQSKSPMGYNLRKGDKLVDLVKEGVLDPALVIEQIIENSASTAGNLLTVGGMAVFEDKDE